MNAKKILLIGGCGYIGSRVWDQLEQSGHAVTVVDLGVRGTFGDKRVMITDYAKLPIDFIQQFEVVIWLAGHSSVSMSHHDPVGAADNNFARLLEFSQKIHPRQKFIYASTGSVYSRKTISEPLDEQTASSIHKNPYDLTKFAFDEFMRLTSSNYIGLRFGTLAGYSRNMRTELVVNSMVMSARNNGVIKMSNPTAKRTILWLEDLTRAIGLAAITPMESGFYNIGSVNATIEDIANAVSHFYNVPIEALPNGTTYNFYMDWQKIETALQTKFQTPLMDIIKSIDHELDAQ